MKTKTNKILTALAVMSIGSAILITGCKKDNVDPDTNPVVIPVQTINMPAVALAGAADFAVLAGSSITSTGATNITGNLGLSPGSSIGGFPPGVLVGTQYINGVLATQAKLDATAAYNDLAGRTSTDIVTLSGNIGGLTTVL